MDKLSQTFGLTCPTAYVYTPSGEVCS